MPGSIRVSMDKVMVGAVSLTVEMVCMETMIMEGMISQLMGMAEMACHLAIGMVHS